MVANELADAFTAFRRSHAPTIFDLALRHSGDTHTAVECVEVVFSELAARWHAVGDPARFIRRAAVLFVYGPRHRSLRHRAVVRGSYAPPTPVTMPALT